MTEQTYAGFRHRIRRLHFLAAFKYCKQPDGNQFEHDVLQEGNRYVHTTSITKITKLSYCVLHQWCQSQKIYMDWRKKNSDGANFLARSAQIGKGHMKSTLNSSMESYVGILLLFCFSSLFFLPSPEDTISIVYYTLQSCIKPMFITFYLHPDLFK